MFPSWSRSRCASTARAAAGRSSHETESAKILPASRQLITPSPSRSALSNALRSSSFEKVWSPSAPKSWWLERSSFFLAVASSTVAKPRPPRRSRVASALASIEARLRGDARAVAMVRMGAARRTMRRNMINSAVVSSKLLCKVIEATRGAARQLSYQCGLVLSR